MMAEYVLSPAWRNALIAIISLFVLMLALYQQTVLYLTGLWNKLGGGDYGHGYLVLAISAYLIFTNRKKLAVLTPCPEYKAVIAIFLATLLWALAALVDIATLQSFALLLLFISMVWAVVGNKIIMLLAFPLLYISFAIPVWFPLSPLLQNVTADAVFWIIRIMEIPAMRVENVIVVPAGRLSIEEACSGLRYLLASLTLGALYGYMNYRSFRSRLIVVLITAGAAVFANVLRVLIVVYLGYKTDMQHPLVYDHLSLGWYLFAGVVAVLLFLDVTLYKMFQLGSSVDGSENIIDSAEGLSLPCRKRKFQIGVYMLLVTGMVSAGSATILWVNNYSETAMHRGSQTALITAEGWSIEKVLEDGWAPKYKGADTQKMRLQNQRGQQVHLFLGFYPVQKQGEELINDRNRIADGEVWHAQYQKERVADAGQHKVLEQLLKNNAGEQRLVWYWYRVAGQATINKYQAKALQVLGLLQGRPQASVIAVSSEFGGDKTLTRLKLTNFIVQMGVAVNKVADGGK